MPRSSTNGSTFLLVLLLAAALQACGDDTNGPDPGLVVDAQVAPGHIHSFETDVTFTATFTDPDEGVLQDFTSVRAEIGAAGSELWTKQVPLLFNGTAYTGTTKFTAAGSFDVRILGQRPGQAEPIELHRLATPLSSVRPHFDAGGYRVEFETDTGEYPTHGLPTTYRFLIMEDVDSPRPPVTGLTGVVVRCTQGSDVEIHAATELPAGTYSASHTFPASGEGTAQIEFTGLDANPAVVQISLDVN